MLKAENYMSIHPVIFSVQNRGSKGEWSFVHISDGIERCAEPCFGLWLMAMKEINQSDSSMIYNMQLTMPDASVI